MSSATTSLPTKTEKVILPSLPLPAPLPPTMATEGAATAPQSSPAAPVSISLAGAEASANEAPMPPVPVSSLLPTAKPGKGKGGPTTTSKQRWKGHQAFYFLDRDGDQFVSLDELSVVSNQPGVAANILAIADSTQDSKLSFAEFTSWHDGVVF